VIGMTEAVYVSQGKKRLVGGKIIDNLGNDISGYAYTCAVGQSDVIPPTTGWTTADYNQPGVNNQQRVVKKLIDSSITPGRWFVWANIPSTPEIEPVVLAKVVVI
jgi:hypothetical protein